jgi:hypothetical protein
MIKEISLEKVNDCLDKRIVLTTLNEVCYAGISRQILTINGNDGLIVQIDENSGFSVWCPLYFIKEILIIPISKETEG